MEFKWSPYYETASLGQLHSSPGAIHGSNAQLFEKK